MADRLYQNRTYHLQPGRTVLEGYVSLDGSGDQDTLAMPGVQIVDHGSTGEYTINLQDKYYALIGLEIGIGKATDAGVRWQLSASDVQSAKTLGLTFFNMSSPSSKADPVSCTLFLRIVLDSNSA